MSDLISRSALYDKIAEMENLARERVLDTPTNSPCYMRYVAQLNERTTLKHMIADAPTIEAVQVVHAEWIEVYDENYETWYYDCSKCGDGFATKEKCQSLPNFCNECGADMRKVGAE